MQCKAWVIQTKKPSRRDKTESWNAISDAYERVGQLDISQKTLTRHPPSVAFPEPPKPDAVLCGGKIRVDVRAVDEADWGSTHAKLEIETVCEKCGWSYHGLQMPTNSDDVSRIITEYVEKL